MARHKVAERIRTLQAMDTLPLGDTIRELMLARRLPEATAVRQERQLARQHDRLIQRIASLQNQLGQVQGQLAEVVAQQVALEGQACRGAEDSYVRGLWAEMSLHLTTPQPTVAQAIDSWRGLQVALQASEPV